MNILMILIDSENGLQSNLIKSVFSTYNISLGDLFRKEILNNKFSTTYNIIYKKPKIKYKDDKPGYEIFSRLDDKYHTFKIRLNKYKDQIDLIIDYFF